MAGEIKGILVTVTVANAEEVEDYINRMTIAAQKLNDAAENARQASQEVRLASELVGLENLDRGI